MVVVERKLVCAFNKDGEIATGGVGYFDQKQWEDTHPDDTVVCIEGDVPREPINNYTVEKFDEDGETKYRLKKKEQKDIDALLPKQPDYVTNLLDIDASSLTGIEKIIVECLQGNHGV